MIPILCMLNACAAPAPKGPGMIVSFGNGIAGTKVLVDDARSEDGIAFPNPGSLAPQSRPGQGKKVMGAAPDGRPLPQWVEFSWIELPYESTHVRTKEELDAVPVRRARISVSERVPADVVAEVMRGNQMRKTGDEALHLWLNFVWQRDGIAFGWQQYRGCCTLLRSGGDQLD